MLSFPSHNDGAAFVIVIDKKAHQEKYVTPEDPCKLSFRFIFEKLEDYLTYVDDYGYCIYD